MRRECGMFLEAIVRNVVLSFFSLSFSKSSCFPPALLPGSVSASRQVFIPHYSKGHSSLCPHCLSLSIEKERLGPDISGYFSFPELLPWLLVGVCTSGWCKIPHSLCFCWTHSLVDFNLQSAPCLPDWKGKIFPGHSRGLIHFQQRPKLLYFPVG